ncbi:hypothetical protein RBB78_02495 [Tunturiibacter empetritectus]|uniref:hypothetical protein n=1 Tax=Tunturiibacter empetritectus TaxID=3069691 RepID=UPI003D9B710E
MITRLAEDLTLRGIAVEGIHDLGKSADGKSNGHLFEMDITTNRVDAMNHFGIAREAATIYNLPLAPSTPNSLSAPWSTPHSPSASPPKPQASAAASPPRSSATSPSPPAQPA